MAGKQLIEKKINLRVQNRIQKQKNVVFKWNLKGNFLSQVISIIHRVENL